MGKRTKGKRVECAVLLEQFVANVDKGLISAPDYPLPQIDGDDAAAVTAARRELASSMPSGVLANMRAAVQRILDGEDPDEAFGVRRARGAPQDQHALLLALAIHNSRAKGEKWSVIEHHVNAYRKERGEQPLSLSRIKRLPKDHASAIDSYLALREVRELLRVKSPN